jgi:hypothetical protein
VDEAPKDFFVYWLKRSVTLCIHGVLDNMPEKDKAATAFRVLERPLTDVY